MVAGDLQRQLQTELQKRRQDPMRMPGNDVSWLTKCPVVGAWPGTRFSRLLI